MERDNVPLLALLGMICVIAGMFVMSMLRSCSEPSREMGLVSDTTHVVVTDTIKVEKPVAKDSVVVRYETVRIPLPPEVTDRQHDSLFACADAIEVALPIEQKVYEDSAYRAWVSGWHPSLDSIEVYNRTEVITITERAKRKRWHIGPSVGWGATPHGLEPFVGVTITYGIYDF